MLCKRPKCENEARENPYKGHKPLYCSQKCKNIDAVNTLRRRRKREAVEYKGGKCSLCGYDNSYSALQFHHINPSEKSFGISKGITLRWNDIVKELDKCVLVCANCHAEQHGEE